MVDLVDDGEVTHPMVKRIAGVRGDPARGIVGLMEQCGIHVPISPIAVGNAMVTSMVLPSHLLQLLCRLYPEKSKDVLGCRDGELIAGCWSHLLLKAPELRALPCFAGASREDLKWIVPCTIHEDAGPYTKKSGVNIVSWTGRFARGGDRCANTQS